MTSKYVTVTGDVIPSGGEYGDRTAEVQIVLDKYMKRSQGKEAPTPSHQPVSCLSDDELLEKAGASKNGVKFNALYSGDITGYSSQSEADMALIGMLAFWCGRDPEQMDRLFRDSGRYRDKWDEQHGLQTYGQITIESAIANCTAVYTPKSSCPDSPTPKKGKPTKPLDMVSAAELDSMDVGELEYRVDGLVHQGLCMLSADPKSGKSLLALDLCLSVASGTQFLERETYQCDTLYLALEDSYRRLQKRMRTMLAGKGVQPPQNCYLVTAVDSMEGELFDQLEEALKTHPSTGLLIVDVFNRIRGDSRAPGKTQYEIDSDVMARLKTFTDTHFLCLLLIHHTKKSKEANDPHLNFLGSQGIFGGVDASYVLTKENRNDTHATLSVISREMDGLELTIELDPDTLLWKCVKNDDADNPIVVAVKALLDTSPDGQWKGSATQLLKAGETITGAPIADDAQSLGYALRKLVLPKEITHRTISNGNAGRLHLFELKVNKEAPAPFHPIQVPLLTGLSTLTIDDINSEGVDFG